MVKRKPFNPDGQRSGQFQYRLRAEPKDQVGHGLYHPCIGFCFHDGGQARSCHLSCLRVVNSALLSRSLEVSAYSCEPPLRQDSERCHQLLNDLASNLQLPIPLPMELREKIAGYLTREYAVAKNRPSLDCQAFEASVTVASAITKCYVTFEGERYLSSLANKPELDDTRVPPTVIYVGGDHLGPKVDCVPGVWWKAMPVQESGTLTFESDGVKVRHVTNVNDSVKRYSMSLRSFAIPRHPENHHRTYPFNYILRYSPTRTRPSMFQYNRPGITGFSVCCDPAPVALHAHTYNEDLSFYQSRHSRSVWIYMPLEKNERIVRIWMRARFSMRANRFETNETLALVFETDRGHVKLFGAQLAPARLACPQILLDVPQGKPGYFFFDEHPCGISHLTFESFALARLSPLVTPKASSPYPGLASKRSFLWSCASVEDAVAVRVCRLKTGGWTEIMGLLFCYADGKEASVGQVRFDCIDQPRTIDHLESLYLGFQLSKEEKPYISRVETSAKQLDNHVSMWFEVSWSGTLEW
ncbi:hypothetical protein EDB81DRAFT_846315 [Dactylonectria macrodidyma]|uniref:Uncharacterized protein n=1 Tax=Dactylonectria macrodidyma TaxID=307937 RepID=A0A9P9INT6_9HYPO|nr:hypothetical protein EDB81DRAFT_846315 [Dactylonectria macrodidyma]